VALGGPGWPWVALVCLGSWVALGGPGLLGVLGGVGGPELSWGVRGVVLGGGSGVLWGEDLDLAEALPTTAFSAEKQLQEHIGTRVTRGGSRACEKCKSYNKNWSKGGFGSQNRKSYSKSYSKSYEKVKTRLPELPFFVSLEIPAGPLGGKLHFGVISSWLMATKYPSSTVWACPSLEFAKVQSPHSHFS
jgi:hypothetical protein